MRWFAKKMSGFVRGPIMIKIFVAKNCTLHADKNEVD